MQTKPRPYRSRPVDVVTLLLFFAVLGVLVVGVAVFGWLVAEAWSEARSATGLRDLTTRLLRDSRLHHAAVRTLGLLAANLTIQLGLVLFVSMFLTVTQSWVKILLIAPALLAPSTLAVSWFLFLSPAVGPAAGLLETTGLGAPSWFVDTWSMATLIVLLDTFQWAPFLIALASFQIERVPQAFFEQAAIEGVSPLKEWLHLRLPALKPVLAAAVLVRFFDLVRLYDPIVVLFGGGGPALSMETVSLYIQKLTFQPGEQAYGAFIGLLFMLVLLASLIAAGNHPLVRGYLPWNLRAT